MLSGAGDELQGIKRGIMEMSDLIAITNVTEATLIRLFAKPFTQMHFTFFLPPDPDGYSSAMTSSAVTGSGLEEIKQKIFEYFKLTRQNGYYYKRERSRQGSGCMKQ